jgi:hypothetical protein
MLRSFVGLLVRSFDGFVVVVVVSPNESRINQRESAKFCFFMVVATPITTGNNVKDDDQLLGMQSEAKSEVTRSDEQARRKPTVVPPGNKRDMVLVVRVCVD